MANLQEGDFGDRGDYGRAFLDSNDAGSGAYAVVSHNKQELTVLERFDDYWLPFAENAPDEVRMRYSLEPATLRALMERGEHDVSSMWHAYEDLHRAGQGRRHIRSGRAADRCRLHQVQRAAAADRQHPHAPGARARDRLRIPARHHQDQGRSVRRRPRSGADSLRHDGLRREPCRIPRATSRQRSRSSSSPVYDRNTSPPVEIVSALCCYLHQKVALLVAANLAEMRRRIGDQRADVPAHHRERDQARDDAERLFHYPGRGDARHRSAAVRALSFERQGTVELDGVAPERRGRRQAGARARRKWTPPNGKSSTRRFSVRSSRFSPTDGASTRSASSRSATT